MRFANTDLTSSVPQLQANSTVLEIHGLAQKINADGRLVRVIKRVIHESVQYPPAP